MSNLGAFNSEQATVENAIDTSIPPVAPAQKVGDRNTILEWGKKLDERVTALEGDMKQVKKDTAEILHRLPSSNS